ncbi:hypothetical protein [Clostridium sp. ZBS2]|uniref:hypothetical protein n=1 Tax=Clostridium sp. ZBS2 TaxID=2949976 RepID=UPI00207ADA4A|nr:hypothetical protein [Clostridium sp. ZBS2]
MDMKEDILVKEFYKKDVFYNNGLVNLKLYLDEVNIEEIKYELTNSKLALKIPKNQIDNYYNEIFKGFLTNNEIVFQTQNKRLYWDKYNGNFIYSEKYDIKGKSTGNDVKNLYEYITPKELEKTTEELFNIYMKFAEKYPLNESNIKEDSKLFRKGTDFKVNSKCRIPLIMTRDEAFERYMDYLIKGDKLKVDSKIHQFEDGGKCFRDMLINKDNYIDKWDALIYWCGVKVKRFYNSSYFIYVNSFDLLSLLEIKRDLFKNITDNPLKVKDKKGGNFKTIPTNVDVYEKLSNDGIQNQNFYISNSIVEFELKFFMYIESYVFNIATEYELLNIDKIQKQQKKLYNSISKMNLVTYTEDGDMKSTFEEYTKSYKVIMFLKKLIETKTKNDSTLFKYFSYLITAITMSKAPKEKVNLYIKRFCENILKFINLRDVYYEVSFKILRNNTIGLGNTLYEFENLYLQEIGRGGEIMSLHSKAKEIGEKIGVFCGTIEDKDLLFKLRNIKNHKQLISYFRDFKFAVLKKQDVARFKNEFNQIMDEIFVELERKPENWEIVRDYIAIYSIDKYKSVTYKISKEKVGN